MWLFKLLTLSYCWQTSCEIFNKSEWTILKAAFLVFVLAVAANEFARDTIMTSFSNPGKVLEFDNFIKNLGKMGVNLEKWIVWEKIVLSWLLQHSFLLYRALPIKMYIWEKFWDSWASVVFSDGRVYGAIRRGMLLDSKKGDRASAISCPKCV